MTGSIIFHVEKFSRIQVLLELQYPAGAIFSNFSGNTGVIFKGYRMLQGLL